MSETFCVKRCPTTLDCRVRCVEVTTGQFFVDGTRILNVVTGTANLWNALSEGNLQSHVMYVNQTVLDLMNARPGSNYLPELKRKFNGFLSFWKALKHYA